MRCILILQSVHQVMRAEKILKGTGIKVDLIPVPREISSDCGVAVELSMDLKDAVLQVLEENRLQVIECFVRDDAGRFERAG
jgi:hypothetical protein